MLSGSSAIQNPPAQHPLPTWHATQHRPSGDFAKRSLPFSFGQTLVLGVSSTSSAEREERQQVVAGFRGKVEGIRRRGQRGSTARSTQGGLELHESIGHWRQRGAPWLRFAAPKGIQPLTTVSSFAVVEFRV
jgi:hypothetical protein